MEKQEIFTMLKTIEALYPQFKWSDETVVLWLKHCREMDSELVLKRLHTHIARSPFPPAISEIAAYPKQESVFLEQTKQWEQEGRERIERELLSGRSKPEPSWLFERSRNSLA